MRESQKKPLSTKTMVTGAILTSLVIILQMMGAFIRFGPFSISLVLVPIVIGAATCGAGIGAWLGLVFGVVVLASGDAAAFLSVNAAGTVITVLVKGVLAGYCVALCYSVFSGYNRFVATCVAAVVCPLVNTGVFLLGCLVFFMDTLSSWAQAAGHDGGVAHYMIFVLVGWNFLFELASNIILSPVIVRLINYKTKQLI